MCLKLAKCWKLDWSVNLEACGWKNATAKGSLFHNGVLNFALPATRRDAMLRSCITGSSFICWWLRLCCSEQKVREISLSLSLQIHSPSRHNENKFNEVIRGVNREKNVPRSQKLNKLDNFQCLIVSHLFEHWSQCAMELWVKKSSSFGLICFKKKKSKFWNFYVENRHSYFKNVLFLVPTNRRYFVFQEGKKVPYKNTCNSIWIPWR